MSQSKKNSIRNGMVCPIEISSVFSNRFSHCTHRGIFQNKFLLVLFLFDSPDGILVMEDWLRFHSLNLPHFDTVITGSNGKESTRFGEAHACDGCSFCFVEKRERTSRRRRGLKMCYRMHLMFQLRFLSQKGGTEYHHHHDAQRIKREDEKDETEGRKRSTEQTGEGKKRVTNREKGLFHVLLLLLVCRRDQGFERRNVEISRFSSSSSCQCFLEKKAVQNRQSFDNNTRRPSGPGHSSLFFSRCSSINLFCRSAIYSCSSYIG